MNEYLDFLRKQFNDRIRFEEKRSGIYQLIAPFYHEDGDMLDIFIENSDKDNIIKISDHGMTIMRLSYEYDIDTPNKKRIFQKMIGENQLEERDGKLYIETPLESLYPSVLQFAQAVGKVSNMRLFKREVIKSLFYEMLDEYVMDKLARFRPEPKMLPIPERDDLEVDYELKEFARPIYVFGIKDDTKARLTTISCLEFQRASIPFKSVAVHEDFEALSRKDRKRITSAADKQFVDLDDFRNNGEEFMEREAA
ncbi:MAG: DUF1828 domain-containing protein [Deltaproteobacteria bacterium]|nr:DUF1828 domain-containing protein [Deltaproteobacteria bacterium]MBW1709486.1 DUF1828 domain-containing protein [Deltaproteobacteria bacterium]MBW1909958.1 DUF1828 domain-containing protein [Deltaproteobacteria bacterium]MBW2033996.1 DUF1828 domain-containing protein [Deltaproteobacteria bacterium]MBW2114052.1 DUF1828 domain-containing protein [Deltaproteobacteria bacterium]